MWPLSRAYNRARRRPRMRKIDTLLADYGSHHRTRGNLVCHAFGITLIVFGILSMLGRIGMPPAGATAAEWLIAAAFLL